MSSFAGYCKACGKPVMHKTLFGTLHVCLTDEELAAKTAARHHTQVSGVARNKLLNLLNAATNPTNNTNREKND